MLSDQQRKAMEEIMFTGQTNARSNTLASLKRRGLIVGFPHHYQITTAGGDALGLPRFEPSAEVKALRVLQDEIISLAMELGYSMWMRVSQDMPENIKIVHLMECVYPGYESQLHVCRNIMKQRLGKA